MNPFLEYLVQNWALILILVAFAIVLKITVFLDKKTIIRMYGLIIGVFLLSICVYIEFYLAETNQFKEVRLVLIAIRYSATPFIIGVLLLALVRRARRYILLPAAGLTVVNIISIFTPIAFGIDDATGAMTRGPLGYLSYVGVGVYSVALVVVLIRQSNKQASEIIPIIFLAFAFASGLVLPFVIGKDFSKIFCTTIAIGLFVYYVFMVLQLTKKDALTGLLNRQAYYIYTRRKTKDITAIITIDMNGLKALNDNQGHLAGDEGLVTLALCFRKAATSGQRVYRIGGDEFVIVCRKTSEAAMHELLDAIKENVAETEYSCSIGYCYSPNNEKTFEQMVKESDEMMYAEKAKHYAQTGIDRRVR